MGWLVLRAGRRHRSSTLVADGKHLLTDVWTSVGVVIGVGLVAVTGWVPLDSLVAIGVALNILWTGWGLVRHAMDGLMDHALPVVRRGEGDDRAAHGAALPCAGEVDFHAIQTRESGRERFVSMHVLVPGTWTVSQGHDLLEQVEEVHRARAAGCAGAHPPGAARGSTVLRRRARRLRGRAGPGLRVGDRAPRYRVESIADVSCSTSGLGAEGRGRVTK